MKTKKRRRAEKKYFTPEQANAMLPLVSRIVRDITSLANDLVARYERLAPMQDSGNMTRAHTEELQTTIAEFERDQERLKEFEEELRRLHVELKDRQVGLIDFPCWMDDHEVCLCWRLGETQLAHWHEIDAGFAGRQKLSVAPQPANRAPLKG